MLGLSPSPVPPGVNRHLNGSSEIENSGQTIVHSTSTKRTSGLTESSTSISRRIEESAYEQVTVLKNSVTSVSDRFISEFDHVDLHYIDSMDIENFLEYIERERLTHMPHRGSKWDKVLRCAEFFAMQVSGFDMAITNFVPASDEAAKLILSASRLLLELGPANAQALETTFGVFYELGLTISFFLRHNELLQINSLVRMEAGQAYNDLLLLVRDVAIYYRVRISEISSSVSLDFNTTFGRHLDAFYRRKNRLTDALWAHKLGDESRDIKTIRQWLSPFDRVVRSLLKDRHAAKGVRDEYTCEWFQRHLLDFARSNDDVLAIVGPASSGKSVLADWIVERLQRPVGKQIFESVFAKVEVDIPGETTSIAVLKRLLLQLLETNIGNTTFFKTLQRAYKLFQSSSATIETALWEALDVGLANRSVPLMVVVDGFDEMKSPEQARTVYKKLKMLSKKHQKVQIIAVGRDLATDGVRKLKITPDMTHNDQRHIAEHAFRGAPQFLHHSEQEREKIIDTLIDNSNGNILWLILTIDLLKEGHSRESFDKAVKAVKAHTKSGDETVRVYLDRLDYTNNDVTLLLSLLATAERPLTIAEISSIISIDAQKLRVDDRTLDVRSEITSTIGSLVYFDGDLVRLRHPVIRTHLAKLQVDGTRIPSLQDAHEDLATRLLAYTKMVVGKGELSFEAPDALEVESLFEKHHLLEYAVRYWVSHFRRSSLRISVSAGKYPEKFKKAFPDSTQLALLEWICWSEHGSLNEVIAMHELARQLNQSILDHKSESIIQTHIICGILYKRLGKMNEARECFYTASRLGQKLLHQYSSITTNCVTEFLSITTTETKRTELVTRREEMLTYIIQACQHTYGKTSDVVIKWHKTLAALYTEIHEEEHAETVWKEIRDVIVTRYGKDSEEERAVTGEISIVLKKGSSRSQIEEYSRRIFETASMYQVWDTRRIEMELKMAHRFEAEGELFLAEQAFVLLWGRLTSYSHKHDCGVDIHVSMVDIAIEYVNFLRRHNRDEEASNILICIWSEYERYDFESETIYLRLKTVGELMLRTGLSTNAESVFKKCRGWFATRGKYQLVNSCDVLISETIEKRTTVQSSTTIVTTTTSSETLNQQVEHTLATKIVTKESLSVCNSLVALHLKQQQWSKAIEVSERTLLLVWRCVMTGGNCALPHEYAAESIELAMQLALCYRKSFNYHKAEEVYLRVFRACRASCNIIDSRLSKAYAELIHFYEEQKRWHELIKIHEEMLLEYRQHHGAKHELTIRTLYLIGSLSSEHGGNAIEFYEEIVQVLNKGSKVCHQDALDAMIFLCRAYNERGSWKKLKTTCEILWETWVTLHSKEFTSDFVEFLYSRYRYVLERHEACEYEVLRKLTIRYRDACLKDFGSQSVTIRAMMELADLSMRKTEHIHEAISMYEEVLTKTSTTTVINKEIKTEIRKQLTHAYLVESSHNYSSVVTKKAIDVVFEQFTNLKVSFGCAHAETLHTLEKLIELYIKLDSKESRNIVRRLLTESVVEIVQKEKRSGVLHAAAKQLGEYFQKYNLREVAFEILAEMRRQIITGKSSAKPVIKLEKHIEKASFVFLVAFEETVRGGLTASYSEIMADLLTEKLLYDSLYRYIKENDTGEILVQGAKLRTFLYTRSRKEQVDILNTQILESFNKKWSSIIKSSADVSKIFLDALLIELGHDEQKLSLADASCVAATRRVRKLLEDGAYQSAYDVAVCSLRFIDSHNAFNYLHNVGHGFRLSALMALRGVKLSKDAGHIAIRGQMLELSRDIIRKVLQACKDSNIDFVRLKLEELNDLVGLLGEQENYGDLQWLLNLLWSSREVQKTWQPATIIAIGRCLVQARFLAGRGAPAAASAMGSATRLCEDIVYNLRSVWGSLDPKTLEMSELLSQLHTAAGHYREAMGVHEDILRLITEGDDDDDRTIDTVSAAEARKQVDLLKAAFQRLNGWDKSEATYHDLVHQVLNMPEYKGHAEFSSLQSIQKWDCKQDAKEVGTFVQPKNWELEKTGVNGNHSIHGSPVIGGRRRSTFSSKRANSNWGMDLIHRMLNGGAGAGVGAGFVDGDHVKLYSEAAAEGAQVASTDTVDEIDI